MKFLDSPDAELWSSRTLRSLVWWKGHLSHLVEKQASALGGFEETRFCLRVRKGSAS